MGTSQSSGGPGSGVPMVPPWTPDPPAGDQNGAPPDREDNQQAAPAPTAPPARFGGARRCLGDYTRTGDRQELARSLGHYVKTGYGGSGTTTRRFGGTAATAGALGNVLANFATGRPAAPGSSADPALLAGRTAQEVMDAVVEAVRPVDGTQDAEAERAAIRDALSELLDRFPEADLLNLDSAQRDFAIERFTAIDVARRFELDLGQTIMEKAPNAATALARLKEAHEFIKQCVSAAFRKLREAGQTLTGTRVSAVVTNALRETFEVFEGYAE